jgi:hypothetical protein
VLAGAGLGLMFATKETFVFTVAAMGLAMVATVLWSAPRDRRVFAGVRPSPGTESLEPAVASELSGARETARAATAEDGRAPSSGFSGDRFERLLEYWNWKHAALALSATFIIWLLLFSSFFTNFAGLADSVRTYVPWFRRAGGHSPHVHPWNFYLQRLAWFHPVKGPAWSEGLILVLAAVGAAVSLAGKKSPLHRFLALYTLMLTAIYSAISYKTPWCLLSFFQGMILLAGVGAAAVMEFFRARPLRIILAVVLLGLTGQLSWQAWRASFVYPADRRNPYVYAQTVPDLLNLVQRTERLARVAPAGYETIVKIIAPENDYWPLPWYLRRFKHVGWYEKVPDDPFAPIVVVSSKLDARLDDKSDHKWIMVGLTEFRPGRFFEQYVELELWKRYVETLPREKD